MITSKSAKISSNKSNNESKTPAKAIIKTAPKINNSNSKLVVNQFQDIVFYFQITKPKMTSFLLLFYLEKNYTFT